MSLGRLALEYGLPFAMGIALVVSGYRRGHTRRDLPLYLLPLGLWFGLHLILGMDARGGDRWLTIALLFLILTAAFVFLAKRWPTGPTDGV